MRVPAAVQLESRDGTITKDARMLNALAEAKSEEEIIFRKRPGIVQASTPTDRLALLWGQVSDHAKQFIAVADLSGATDYAIRTDSSSANVAYGTASFGSSFAMPATLVYGCAFMDGYFFVLTVGGRLYNSPPYNPTTWPSTDYVALQGAGGEPIAVMRYLNNIFAFTTISLEPFFNAGNPTGSVLQRVGSGTIEIGCASARSIASAKGGMFWLGKEAEGGLGVYRIQGLAPQRISTPDVDRIIAADNLSTVYGQCMTMGGHDVYVLTLGTTGVSLMYDMANGMWSTLSFLTVAATKSVTSITRSGEIATVACTAHGFADGDPILMAGATPADYNGIKQITYVDANTFTFDVTGSPTTPATGTITAAPYTEGIFPFVRYVGTQTGGVMLKSSGATWYAFSDTIYQDDGVPINCFVRSARLDAGALKGKTMPSIVLVGDKVSTKVAIRYSDDDSATFTTYRRADMTDVARPEIRRCGSFQKRSIELRHVENTALKIDALDIDVRA